jgi:hypothetical protein
MGLHNNSYTDSNAVINITGEHFGGKPKMGDMIAILNVLQYMRNTNNNQTLKFYLPDEEIQPNKDYVQIFKNFLLAHSNYLSPFPGSYTFEGSVEIWSFRENNGDLVSIDNNNHINDKICIFPLLDAAYNDERNWPHHIFQKIIDEYSNNYPEYEKYICTIATIPDNINIRNFKISNNIIDNLYHILTCKHFIGGDTGMSHFASALNNTNQIKNYYYHNGYHGGWRSIFTAPFNINKGNNKMHLYNKIDYNIEILKELLLYNPVNSKLRLGRNFDGGYVIIDNYDYDFLISGGVGGDVSFEIDFMKKYSNIEGVCFDGTTDKPDDMPQQISFIKKNIAFHNSDTTTNLVEYAKNYNNIFCKIDIEGGEWNLFKSDFKHYLPNVKQLVIELHDIFDADINKLEALRLLNQTHYLVHVHANNHCQHFTTIDNRQYPVTLEFAYIRKDCEINGVNINDLPIPNIDYKNAINYSDHDINFYPFNMSQ